MTPIAPRKSRARKRSTPSPIASPMRGIQSPMRGIQSPMRSYGSPSDSPMYSPATGTPLQRNKYSHVREGTTLKTCKNTEGRIFEDNVERHSVSVVGKTFEFYVVKKGACIYRGDVKQYYNQKDFNNTLEYFSDYETAETYGTVLEFRAKKNLHFLVMSDLGNLQMLYDAVLTCPDPILRNLYDNTITHRHHNDASKNRTAVLKAITESFGYSPRTPRVLRTSEYEKDATVALFLCKIGLDGYAHGDIEAETTEKKFHPEIALCGMDSKVDFKGVMPHELSTYEIHELAERRTENDAKKILKFPVYNENVYSANSTPPTLGRSQVSETPMTSRRSRSPRSPDVTKRLF